MKRLIAIITVALMCSIVSAQDQDAGGDGIDSIPGKSIFSVDVGYANDCGMGHGYGVFIKSSSFIGAGPVYYGFGSIFGEFITTGENFFETGLFVGYNDFIGNTGLDFDVFLDVIVTGGRIHKETMSYRAEAPALHPGISLGFPASSDIDGTVTFAPVIRPYDALTGEWDFSRSYFTVSLALRFKSFVEMKKLPWNYSSSTDMNPEVTE